MEGYFVQEIEAFYRHLDATRSPHLWGPTTRALILRTTWRNNRERHWLHRRLVAEGVPPSLRRDLLLLRTVQFSPEEGRGWMIQPWRAGSGHDIAKLHRHIAQMEEQVASRDPSYWGYRPSPELSIADWMERPEAFDMST